MIGPNSRFLVLSPAGNEIITRGAFKAQLDASHFLVDTHADGLYSQRVVSPAEMKQMHIFPNDAAYNEFVTKRFPAPAPKAKEDFELSDADDITLMRMRDYATEASAQVDEVGADAAQEDEVSMRIASENCG